MGRLLNIVFTLYVVAGTVYTEPCNDYKEIIENERAANIVLNINTTDPLNDDRLNDGWYRVVNDVGEEMATSPPGAFKCTTWFPVWLNGSLPSTINVTVTTPVCLQYFQSICNRTWNIDIKRCPGNYLVYNLKTSPITSSAYCFGWAVPCPAGQTGWSPNCKNSSTTSPTTISSTTVSSTTVSSTTVSSTTASSTTTKTTSSEEKDDSTGNDGGDADSTDNEDGDADSSDNDDTGADDADDDGVTGKQKKKENRGINIRAIVCVIVVVIACLLFGALVLVLRHKLIQRRCTTDQSQNKENLYQEITIKYNFNKENDHIYNVPVIYPHESPPPYSSRRPSASSGIINSNGWTVEPQSPPVYLFKVDKK